MEEKWVSVVGYEEFYCVSNFGRIMGKKRGKVLSPAKNGQGYLHINLYLFGKRRTFSVHKIVAMAFLGIRPEGTEVNHKDVNKANNAISNLEYITHDQNILHGIKNKRFGTRGERNFNAKFNGSLVRLIRDEFGQGRSSMRALARRFNVYPSTISSIIKGKTWCHVN